MAFRRQGLLLREVEPRDLPMLRDLRNHPDSWQGWRDPRSVQTMMEQDAWYATLSKENMAFVAHDEAVVGDVGLLRISRFDPLTRSCALTGCDVFPSYQRQGYGSRILRAGAEYALLDLGWHRVTAEHIAGNIAAQRIILRAGFQFEGTFKDYIWRDGRWHNWLVYAMLQDEVTK